LVWWRSIEEGKGAKQGSLWVCHGENAVRWQIGFIQSDDDRGRASLQRGSAVSLVGIEREMAWTGVFERGNTGHHLAKISAPRASQETGYLTDREFLHTVPY
jgi:hypothetical protein